MVISVLEPFYLVAEDFPCFLGISDEGTDWIMTFN
jgi:hypothetical protein